ncbi:MAG: carbohydrate kinase family protein [Acutalibacteraceae bacterium]|nr:carbohydrate kinase family protein [Acutalibacteraceae bacterium]
MGKIVAIGANVIDTIAVLPNYPKEDTKLRASKFMQSGGGPAATGLVAAAKLGAKACFIGNAADDSGGVFLLNDFKRFGVDTSLISVKKGYRSFASQIWLSEDSAARTCVFDKGDLPPLELTDTHIAAIEQADVLMVDGNELEAAIAAAKIANRSKTLVLYDAGGLYDGVERLLPLVDILIPSKEYALGITGETDAASAAKKLYDEYNARVVVVTCGKDGGVMYDGDSVQTYPAYPANVVDSNGAGDVFHGAFAAALTYGYDYISCCRFASATSALKCEKVGARDAVPSKDEVIKLLEKCGVTL